MYLLGFDIGSSSVKASLVDAESGIIIGTVFSPDTELELISKKPGWAEQDPETWWEHVTKAAALLKRKTGKDFQDVRAIGISYQMHGLVLVDKNLDVLRPSIIWCDSRAVETGERVLEKIGRERALRTLLNFPGNFTASKIKWVMDNEPEIYARAYKAMLPGDYIAMRLTGEIATTVSGLSEQILWDYEKNEPARLVLDAFGISDDLIPRVVPSFGKHGTVHQKAASLLGVKAGTEVTYRAGDQPNNALSLFVLEPGEVATTAGTSGVVYGVSDKPHYDQKSRVNTFVHVNHSKDEPRYGTLMCINGCGSAYRWLKQTLFEGISYDAINSMAEKIEPGSNGARVFPYGNGAERTLGNSDPGAFFGSINFNIHNRAYLARACQEGIVYAFNYGFEIMKGMGLSIAKVKAGNANLFLSPVFRSVFVNTLGIPLEIYETDGSQGAARGAGIGVGLYKNYSDAFSGLSKISETQPDEKLTKRYSDLYGEWAQHFLLKHN